MSSLALGKEDGHGSARTVLEVEGSAEEIEKLLPQIGKAMTLPVVEAEEDEGEAVEDGDNGEITAELAYYVLSRHPPLRDSHQALLETLYLAHPNLVGWKLLCAKLGRKENQAKGVIGSFERRVVQTPGIKRGMKFLIREATIGEEWRYGLVDAARSAITAITVR